MKTAYILVGLPYSGKSTYAATHPELTIISTDSIIEQYAKDVNRSYNDVFNEYYSTAEQIMVSNLDSALEEGKDILIDRTNLTMRSRARWIKKLKRFDYRIIAVTFDNVSVNELFKRREARTNKFICDSIMNTMMNSYQEPGLDEGFSDIIIHK